MPTLRRYQPSYSFTGWQASNPSRPLPAQRIDIEFQNIQDSIASIISGGTGGGPGGGSGGGSTGPVSIDDVIGLPSALVGKADASALSVLSTDVVALRQSVSSITVSAIVGGGLAAVTTSNGTSTVNVPAASQAEAEAGLNNTRAMTPLRVAQAIAALGANQGGSPVGPADAAAIVRTPIYYDKAAARTDSRLFGREGTTQDAHAYKLVEVASPYNTNYAAGNYVASHIRHVAEGTDTNGPRGAALGLGVSMFKEGFATGTAKRGEIDGIYVVVRQDSPRDANTQASPNKADGCGILIDVATFDKVGFVGGIEGATSILNDNGVGTKRRLVYQFGCTDTAVGGASIGLFTSAGQGRHDAGLQVYNAENDGGYFDNMIYCGNSAGQIFGVDRRGVISIGRLLNNGQHLNPAMHMTLQSDYSLGWLNADKSVQLLNLNQNGDLSAYGQFASKSINATGNVSASGNIIAGGKLQARYIDLAPGGDPANGASGTPGRLWVGPSGKLRFYDTAGQAKYVVLSTSG